MSKLKDFLIQKNHERKYQWDKAYFYKYTSKLLSTQGRLLDLACGNGYFLQLTDVQTVGIDKNFQNLLEAKNHSSRIVCGDILALPFPSASFDGINCSHVLEHFLPDDAYILLAEMDRVLRRRGLLVISTPVLWDGFFRDFTHVKPYYPESIMHYYADRSQQTTKPILNCFYEIRAIKWRYKKLPLKPLFLPRGAVLNTASSVLVEFLNKLGCGKYAKIGYTMVLEKVR